jgi:hypothetical protein
MCVATGSRRSTRFVASRPDAIAAARRAIIAAHAALKRDVTLAGAVGRRLFPSEQAALITELVRRDLPFYSASIAPHAVASLNRFAREVGLLKGDGASADIVAG